MFEGIKKYFSKTTDDSKYKEKVVLIVDDNEVDLKIIEKTLDKIGCQVLTAVDGLKGLEMCISEKPDLVLSDCSMPGLDGLEMCRQIREDPRTKEIPFIFLTGNDSPESVINCFELEASSYMCKPINAKVLSQQIMEILDEYL